MRYLIKFITYILFNFTYKISYISFIRYLFYYRKIRVGSEAVCNYLFQADLISTPTSGKFFSEYLIGLENISAALLPLPLIQEEYSYQLMVKECTLCTG